MPIHTNANDIKQPKKKRSDYYFARVDIKIPLDMNNADSLAQAIKATQAIKDTLPAGSECTVYGTLGKL